MNIKKSITAVAAGFIACFAVSQSCYAFSVFADFNGDMVFDPSVDVFPGSTITVGVYASQTATEVATNGGLNGFGLDLTTGGLPVTGNNIDSITIDPQWNFATTREITDPTIASVRVIGNTLIPGGFEDLVVHLFNISLDVPNVVGVSYLLNFSDIPGDSFVSNNFFVYDDFVIFAESQVNAVPIPAAAWLMLSGLLGLAGVGRRVRRNTSITS